jgi:prolipoprotein diacylglyceryltransferase
MMFGIYLMMNGLERFSVELIRVNTRYHVGGLSFTQAELISSLLFICGLLLVVFAVRNKEKHANY